MDGAPGSVYRTRAMTRIRGHFTYRDRSHQEAARNRLGERPGWRWDGDHLLCDTEVDRAAEDWNDLLLDLSESASDGTIALEHPGQPPYVYAPRYERGYRPPAEVDGMVARIGSVRHAHPEPVERIAWSPDGRYLAVAITDRFSGHIWLWDAHTGALVHELTAREGESFGYSSSGIPFGFAGPDRLVALGMDEVVRTWDLSTGRLTAWRECEDLAALGVGPGVVAVPGEECIELLRSDTLEVERTVEYWSAGDARGLTVDVAADNTVRLLVSGRHDVDVLDLATGEELSSMRERHEALAAFGECVALTCRREEYDEDKGEDVTSYVVKLYRGAEFACEFAAGASAIGAVAVAGDAVIVARGYSVAAYGLDGAALWEQTAPALVSALAVRGDALAIGTEHGRVHLMDDYRSGGAIESTPPKRGVLTPDGHLLDYGRRFHVATGAYAEPLPEIECACVSSDGTVAAAQPSWRELVLIDARPGDTFGERMATIETPSITELHLWGAHVVALGESEQPGLFDVGSGKLVHSLWEPSSEPDSEPGEPQGLTVRAGSALAWAEDQAQLWSLPGQHVRTFEQPVNCGALGPDGAVYLGSDEHLSRLNPDTGELLWKAPGHVSGIVASPSGRTVIAHNGGTLSIYDARTGERTATRVGHRGINQVGFLPSGLLLTLGSEGTAVTWDVGESARPDPDTDNPDDSDFATVLQAIEQAQAAAELPLPLQAGETWPLADGTEVHAGALPDVQWGLRGRLRYASADKLSAALGRAEELTSRVQVSGLTIDFDLDFDANFAVEFIDWRGDRIVDDFLSVAVLKQLAALAQRAVLGQVVAVVPDRLSRLHFQAGEATPGTFAPLAPPAALRRWGVPETSDPDEDLLHVGDCIWWLNNSDWDQTRLEVRAPDFSPGKHCDLPAELDITVSPTGTHAAIQLPNTARYMARLKNMRDEVGILRMNDQLEELDAIGPRNMNYDDLQFSPDGRYLAMEVEDVKEYESWIEVWDWQDNRLVVRFEGEFRFLGADESGNQRLVWADEHLHLVDLGTGETVAVTANEMEVQLDMDSVEFAAESGQLVTRTDDELVVWSASDLGLVERRPLPEPAFGAERFQAIAINDSYLAIFESGSYLTVMDRESGAVRLRQHLDRELSYEYQLAFLGEPRGARLAVIDHNVRILDVETGAWQVSEPCKVTCLGRAGDELVTGHEDGLIRWWGPDGETRRERVSEDKVVAVASGDGLLWVDENGCFRWAGQEYADAEYSTPAMAVFGDLAAWTADDGVRIGGRVVELTTGSPYCMAFHPSGDWLAVGTVGGIVLLTRDGQLRGQIQGHDSTPSQLAFTPDGTRMYSLGSESLIEWDVDALGDGHPPDEELDFDWFDEEGEDAEDGDGDEYYDSVWE